MNQRRIEIAPTNYLDNLAKYDKPIIATTPPIGKDNPTVTLALVELLREVGLQVVEVYPEGIWIKIAQEFHIGMTKDIKKSFEYTKKSIHQRDSLKTKPLLWELERILVKKLQENPLAQFIITPQNMLGELLTTVQIKGKKYNVIMFLPDAMGKLSQHKKLTPAQRAIDYLVWNRAAYIIMTQRLGLESVQLVEFFDLLKAYQSLSKEELIQQGFQKLFETDPEKTCIIKLSGSGGDPNYIKTILLSLWEKSGIISTIFPGQERTGKKLHKSVGHRPSEQIIQSLDEGHFYNLVRNLENGYNLLTYPSGQVLHLMILSQKDKQVRTMFLPPRGDHELTNLINYMVIATEQHLMTSICFPDDFEQRAFLHQSLKNAGFSPNLHYRLVNPNQATQNDFHIAPSWEQHEEQHKNGAPRIPIAQAISNIISRHT